MGKQEIGIFLQWIKGIVFLSFIITIHTSFLLRHISEYQQSDLKKRRGFVLLLVVTETKTFIPSFNNYSHLFPNIASFFFSFL